MRLGALRRACGACLRRRCYDAILSNYQVDDRGGAAEYAWSEDMLVVDVVALESVTEVEEGVRASRVVQYEQWKEIDGAETWCGSEASKERKRMDREAHQLLMSARARQS